MSRRSARGAWATLALVAAALLTVQGAPTTSGALSRGITNSTNTAASAVFGTCVSSANAIGAYLVWPFDEASGTTARDTSANNRPGTYNAGGLLGGTLTYGAAGPCPRDGARAVTLTTGLLGGVTSGPYVTGPATAITGQQTFSAGVWFRTTTAAGGKLIGFGSSATGASGSYDRHIYMATDGTLYAGVYPGATKTVNTASKKYNDGAWHFAMMTLGAGGLSLYVDGVTSTALTDSSVTTAQSFTGYWRVGYDNLNTWPGAPATSYFNGSVAFAQVYGSALTATQVATLYASGR